MTDTSKDRFLQKHADFCFVFSNPNRLRLFYRLRSDGRATVSELEAATGISQSTISQHLKLMRDKDIVTREKEGVNSYYSIADERIVAGMDLIAEVVRERHVA
mgnify:CR=1 FL=1